MKIKEVSIKIGDKELENPFARFFSTILLSFVEAIINLMSFGLMALLSSIVSTLAMVLIAVFSPVLIPAHFILKACGRKGFCRNTEEDKTEIRISTKAFSKL